MSELYEEMFGEKAPVLACHAGLECGILGSNYPDMQMISFGPNIRGAHSPDEKVQISSVQKYWAYLMETLKRIPRKVISGNSSRKSRGVRYLIINYFNISIIYYCFD